MAAICCVCGLEERDGATHCRAGCSTLKPKPGRPAEKQSLYFSVATCEEMNAEAKRLKRSRSWVFQQAWRKARAQIRAIETPMRLDDEAAQ